MKIWFDLCHPPHVLFFAPQIKELNKRGIETVITVRNRFQVCELCDLAGLPYVKIGHDYGKRKISKALGVFIRTVQLIKFTFDQKIDLAVSQGSSYQVLAAFLLRIPSIFMTDYEHIFMWIANTFASKICMPEIIPDSVLQEKGLNLQKICKYPGFKENVYISNVDKNSSLLKNLGIQQNRILALVRPPATGAHYHNVLSEKLYTEVISYLLKHKEVMIVILPRSNKEKTEIQNWEEYRSGRIVMPEKTIVALDLIYQSDIVISGGGTMNREAAVLDVPVYTIFKGQIGAVDRYLNQQGKLNFIETVSDISKIKIEKKNGALHSIPKESLTFFLVDKIIETSRNGKKYRSH